jgi:hypothetical protein
LYELNSRIKKPLKQSGQSPGKIALTEEARRYNAIKASICISLRILTPPTRSQNSHVDSAVDGDIR